MSAYYTDEVSDINAAALKDGDYIIHTSDSDGRYRCGFVTDISHGTKWVTVTWTEFDDGENPHRFTIHPLEEVRVRRSVKTPELIEGERIAHEIMLAQIGYSRAKSNYEDAMRRLAESVDKGYRVEDIARAARDLHEAETRFYLWTDLYLPIMERLGTWDWAKVRDEAQRRLIEKASWSSAKSTDPLANALADAAQRVYFQEIRSIYY